MRIFYLYIVIIPALNPFFLNVFKTEYSSLLKIQLLS